MCGEGRGWVGAVSSKLSRHTAGPRTPARGPARDITALAPMGGVRIRLTRRDSHREGERGGGTTGGVAERGAAPIFERAVMVSRPTHRLFIFYYFPIFLPDRPRAKRSDG